MKNVVHSISKQKGCCSHQVPTALPYSPWWALREFRVETEELPSAKPSATAATLDCPPRGGSGWEGILALNSEDAHQRNDVNEPRLFHPPVHTKMLNSLTWQIWFSLTEIFWSFNYLVFVAKAPVYPGSSLQTSLSELTGRLYPSLSPQFYLPNER